MKDNGEYCEEKVLSHSTHIKFLKDPCATILQNGRSCLSVSVQVQAHNNLQNLTGKEKEEKDRKKERKN